MSCGFSFKTKILSGIMATAVFSTVFLNLSVTQVSADEVSRMNNIMRHEYVNGGNWSCPEYSNLITTSDGGYMIFQGNEYSDDYLVEYYDSSFNFKRSQIIERELPVFGCFYTDGSNYYILSGQTNYAESDTVECYRLTKYSLAWSRLSECSMYDCDTVVPFDAGRADITSYDSRLVIRSTHLKYKTDDGLNHQSNITFFVDTSSMSLISKYLFAGYCSHCFNEYVTMDNDHVICADQGDAFPRAIAVQIEDKPITDNSGYDSFSLYPVLEFKGSLGDNETYADLGGLEVSSSSYIVVGNSIDQCENSNSDTRNIFVGTVSKADNSAHLNWLTDYDDSDNNNVGNPFLVKINDDRFAVIWSRDCVYRHRDITYTTAELDYAFVDGNGNLIGEVISESGLLSDCQPIYSNGYIIWYTFSNDNVNFYKINASTGELTAYNPLPVGYANISVPNILKSEDETEPPVEVVWGNKKLVEGVDYTAEFTFRSNKGYGFVEICGIGDYYGRAKESFEILEHAGWLNDNDRWYYYDDSLNLVVGWKSIGGHWYYFGDGYLYFDDGSSVFYSWECGAMVTGWKKIGGKWYYFDKSGAMITGWKQINNIWYYFGTDGAMATGWRLCGNSWYYFNSSGAMVTGWQMSGTDWYYLSSSGAMVTGWQQINGIWYYFESSGAMLTGWKASGGTWYYFNDSGAMVTGWKEVDGDWYYFESSGSMKTGWYCSGGTWYYFLRSGVMVTGELEINGITYIFNTDGACMNP